MSPPYEIIRYRPEFRDRIIEVQKYLWSDDTVLNAEYFAWKHVDNPHSDDIPIFLAVLDGQVVGMRGLMGAAWQIGRSSETFLCPCVCDSVVIPSHRRRGLLQKILAPAMEDLADRGRSLAFNLSASPIAYFSFLKMGWRLVGPYKPWRWQTRSKSIARGVRGFMRGRPGIWRYADRRIPFIERNDPAVFQPLFDYFARADIRDRTALRFEFLWRDILGG